jgi:uronate dehydrogenase
MKPLYLSKRQQVLVTGAAGAIGRSVCRELIARGHRVRGFDRVSPPKTIEGLTDMRLGDLEHHDAVNDAVAGVDAVVHLAAKPDESDFKDELLGPNVVGAYHVLESARHHKVGRVVLTSTSQVIDGKPWTERTMSTDEPLSPKGHYAVTKILAETWGLYYSQQHNMSVIVVRPGGYLRGRPELQAYEFSLRDQRIYLSPGDAGRFYALCVEVQNVSYAILYATSQSVDDTVYLDLEPAQRIIGYIPQDRWPPTVEDLDA